VIQALIIGIKFHTCIGDNAKADFTFISHADMIKQLILEDSDPTSVILDNEEPVWPDIQAWNSLCKNIYGQITFRKQIYGCE